MIDRLGRTVLHLAVMHGLNDLVKFLLEKGVDYTIEDIDGSLPIFYAIDFKRQ